MTETVLAVFFWVSLACVFYTYVGYPLLIGLVASIRPCPAGKKVAAPKSVSVVISARDEEQRIASRLEELLELTMAFAPHREVILVSDGSSDATADVARAVAQRNEGVIQVIEWGENRGKAAALNEAAKMATGEALVFADARQRWAEGSVEQLLGRMTDENIAGVSGELVLEQSSGQLAAVGAYWRFEKWLRRTESTYYSQIGVTGAIAAVRREAFKPIPPGAILDDVYWPMQVVLNGKRVVFEPSAQAFDRLPERVGQEFRRKVRTLAGNYQLMASEPRLLLPFVNPAWLSFVSHKALRLVCPWALLITLFAGYLLGGWLYGAIAAAIALAVLVSLIGLIPRIGQQLPLAGPLGGLFVLQVAAGVALLVWLTGRTDRLWTRSAYLSKGKAPADLDTPTSLSDAQGESQPTMVGENG